MWKKIFAGTGIILLFAAGFFWFWYMKEVKTPLSNAVSAIPIDAAFVFESKQSQVALHKLIESNMWEELVGISAATKLNAQFQTVDSVLNTAPKIVQLLSNQSLFISAHVSGTNSFDFLYSCSIPYLQNSIVNDFFKAMNDSREPDSREYDDVDIHTIHPKNDSLSFAFFQGIFMMSRNYTLVEDAIRQLKSGISFLTDTNFKKIINTAGKKIDGSLYINYEKLPAFLSCFVKTAIQEDANDLSNFADYTGWDVTIKDNSVQLNGFTQANDSSNRFLTLFAKQKPQEVEFTKIAPSTTALFLFYGMNDIKSFRRDYKKYLNFKQRAQPYDQFVAEINGKYRINIERNLTDWITKEVAVVFTEPTTTDLSDNFYAVLHANNINEADKQLNAVVDSVCKRNSEKKDTSNYLNYVITHLKIPNLLPTLLGWQFAHIHDSYFTTVDDYVVLANSAIALKQFVKDFQSNKTLQKNRTYQTFMENMSSEASIYFYADPSRLGGFTNSFLQSSIDKEVQKEWDRIKKFEKIGIQFSTNKNFYYSTAFISYNPVKQQQLDPLWELKVDTSFQMPPFLVTKNDAKDIFIQDDSKTLLYITNEGVVKWKKKLPEAIKENVFQPLMSKNAAVQLLFYTPSTIYKTNEKGRNLGRFPISPASAISNEMNVVSYDNSTDYRILYTCADRTVHCLNPSGNAVADFKIFKTDNLVTLAIQHFKVKSKDYLCAIDIEGKIYITDRQGESKIKIKGYFPQLTKKFYIDCGNDADHTYLVTADSTGKIVRISLAGFKEQFRPQRFDGVVSMTYCDVTNDGNKEYVFQSKNELCIYDQRLNLLSHYNYKEEMIPSVSIYRLPDGTIKIGTVALSNNLIYLFNANGKLFGNFPVKGNTRFVIGELFEHEKLALITGTGDNTVVAYPLE